MASDKPRTDSAAPARGITRIAVRGFKSIVDEQAIEIRPLTILAGANSSGKSSIMQPLLLMKQTLETPFDPGALRLDGPNAQFTKSDQFLSRSGRDRSAGKSFSVTIEAGETDSVEVDFAKSSQETLVVSRTRYRNEGSLFELVPDLSSEEIIHRLRHTGYMLGSDKNLFVDRLRCFLRIGSSEEQIASQRVVTHLVRSFRDYRFENLIPQVIHLPGLRGNPSRSYPVTGVSARFLGTFESYVASVIEHWQANKDTNKLTAIGEALRTLGLTWKVVARRLDDTRVELRVGRLPQPARGGARDVINIADVGLGVSQTLPVVVALVAAQPGQLVYLEQPEIHLHPRAQIALAKVIAEAARRGVRVVVETHSELLILGVQTLVGEGSLPAEDVKLHWFERGEDGVTRVTSADLDERGTFGDWPEDFSDVTLRAQGRFLDAVSAGVEID